MTDGKIANLDLQGVKLTQKKRLCAVILNGTPKQIRIAVYTVKGCCPRPLDDGGLCNPFCTNYLIVNKTKCQQLDFNFFISSIISAISGVKSAFDDIFSLTICANSTFLNSCIPLCLKISSRYFTL